MKRILGLAIAFLALGFAASVATAWAIAIWFPFETKAVPEGASLHEIDLGALATQRRRSSIQRTFRRGLAGFRAR